MINEVCKLSHLSSNEQFVNKTVQLYESLQVRHGVMLLGNTMVGKSKVIKTLSEAISCKNIKEAGHRSYRRVYRHRKTESNKMSTEVL